MTWTFWLPTAVTLVLIVYIAWDARRNEQSLVDIATDQPATPNEQLLRDVAIRATHRREVAEADHARLCKAWNGHELCNCYECDVLAEVAFDGASPVEAARAIRERRAAGEIT